MVGKAFMAASTTGGTFLASLWLWGCEWTGVGEIVTAIDGVWIFTNPSTKTNVIANPLKHITNKRQLREDSGFFFFGCFVATLRVIM